VGKWRSFSLRPTDKGPATSLTEVKKLVVLMIEVEQPEGVSARKLVLETAKHNVITAYSGKSGLQLFHRFPNVDAVVIHSRMGDLSCSEIARSVKTVDPLQESSGRGELLCTC
jgi:response regulator RpfG family c-di-GMP phosphodiesterase